jgi:hypothetical protein
MERRMKKAMAKNKDGTKSKKEIKERDKEI